MRLKTANKIVTRDLIVTGISPWYDHVLALAVANAGSYVGPQKTGHPTRRHGRLMQVAVLSAHGIQIGSKTCVIACHNGDIVAI